MCGCGYAAAGALHLAGLRRRPASRRRQAGPRTRRGHRRPLNGPGGGHCAAGLSRPPLAILTVIFVFGVRKDAVEQHTTATLTARGVTTLAIVLSSSYDAGGGDPGGWTTDQISFTTTTGQTQTATVKLHNNATPERASGHLPVIYDPNHPETVMSVADHHPVSAGGVGIGIGFVTLFGLAGIAFLSSALKVTPTKRTTPET